MSTDDDPADPRTVDPSHDPRLVRPLLHNPFLGLCIHRDFRPLFANDAYARFIGLRSGAELLRHDSVLGFLHPQERLHAQRTNEALMHKARTLGIDATNQAAAPKRVTNLTKDGDVRWLDLTDLVIEWEGEPALYVMVKDVTWEVRAEEQLADSLTREEAQFDNLLRSIPCGIALYDKQARLVRYNEIWRNIWDLPEEIARSRPHIRDLVEFQAARGDLSAEKVGERMQAIMTGWDQTGVMNRETTSYNGDRAIHVQGQRLPDGGMIFTYMDITERKRMEEALRIEASTDSLTGAPNRRQFMTDAQRLVSAAERYDRPLTLLLLDVDHFKRINDTHGHAFGDRALVSVAQAIRSQLRDSDIFGRLGGEEFAACLPETGSEEAATVTERLRQAIAAIALKADRDPRAITVSIGLATWRSGPCDLETLLRIADDALYRAKQNGRNRVEIGTPPPAP